MTVPLTRSRLTRFPLRFATVIAALVIPPLAASPASAGGGANPDLDPTFGNGGRTVTTIARSSTAADLAMTRGRRIIVIGSTTPGGQPRKLAVVRYGPNGHLDTAFGDNGRVVIGFDGRNVTGSSLALFASGEFVVGGTLTLGGTGESTFALARFHRNGRLDQDFGNGGRAVAQLPAGLWRLSSVVRQVDGKLLAVGQHTISPTESRFALVRFDADGSMDTSYGSGGVVETRFPSSRPGATEQQAAAEDVAIDVQGRAVAVGWGTRDGCNFFWALARYLPNGDLDRTFGGDGRVRTRFNRNDMRALAVEVGDDNRITVGGFNRTSGCGDEASPGNGTTALARYLPGGRLDPSFGGDGRVTTAFLGSFDSAPLFSDLTLEEGGQIAATGGATRVRQRGSVVIVGEYLRTGAPNTAFSGDGRAVAAGPLRFGSASALFEDPDGRPVVAGTTFGDDALPAFLVERFRASGVG